VVWASLLKKPLEVVCRRPRRVPATARDGRDAPHARAAHFPTAVPHHGWPWLWSLEGAASFNDGSLSLLGVASLLAYVGRCMAAS
jgi:hypothetical protein